MLRPCLRAVLVAFLAVPVLLGGPALAQSQLSPEAAERLQAGLTETADAFILPAYEGHAVASADLAASLDAYCAGAGEIADAHRAFADTFLAWQRASLIGVGPVKEAEGPLRVQLWPDSKGFARRAVRAAVNAQDPDLIAPGGLDGRSIALTSLTALEHLIYDGPAPGGYACDLATAVARHQAKMAEAFATAWTPGAPFRTAFDTAAGGNDRFPNLETLIRQTLAGAVVHVDRLRKFKLLRGLGEGQGQARAERTEARASGLGLASIAVSFRALADLYDVPFGLFDVAPELGGAMDYLSLAQTASTYADTLEFADADLVTIAEEDGAMAAELRGAGDRVLRHEAFLKSRFPASLGLTAGFTAADGD